MTGLWNALRRKRTHPTPTRLWPDTVIAAPRRLSCGDGHSATYLVVDYPGEVSYAWLEPLITAVERAEVSIHLDAVDAAVAAARLKRQRARLESTRRYAANRDSLDDPAVESAAGDAADLAGRVARGQTRMFTLSAYVTVHAPTLAELDAACAQLKAAATAAMLEVRPATFRQLPGIASTLPWGADALGAVRTVDTEVAAAAWPFCSPDAPEAPEGVLYGLNLFTGAPVMWDRWDCDNHNSVVVARSGAGKSYFAKNEILRQLYAGVQVCVIDPDGEYAPLADHVGGAVVAPGQMHLNPLELPAEAGPDALTRRVMFVHTLVSTMLGAALTSPEAAALDEAVLAAYAECGITADAQTWTLSAPTMRDVHTQLHEAFDADLARRLAPYVTGGLSGLFTGAVQSAPAGHLAVYSLKDLPEELTAAATVLTLDAIWRRLVDDGRRRLVVVDEAWLLLRQGPGALFLSRLAKAARKKQAGLMTVTQDADDMLSTELGHTVVANAATQVLLRQAPQSLETVAAAFRLTEAERDLLAACRRGEALLVSGDTHVAFRAVASPAEHQVCLTGLQDPP